MLVYLWRPRSPYTLWDVCANWLNGDAMIAKLALICLQLLPGTWCFWTSSSWDTDWFSDSSDRQSVSHMLWPTINSCFHNTLSFSSGEIVVPYLDLELADFLGAIAVNSSLGSYYYIVEIGLNFLRFSSCTFHIVTAFCIQNKYTYVMELYNCMATYIVTKFPYWNFKYNLQGSSSRSTLLWKV